MYHQEPHNTVHDSVDEIFKFVKNNNITSNKTKIKTHIETMENASEKLFLLLDSMLEEKAVVS